MCCTPVEPAPEPSARRRLTPLRGAVVAAVLLSLFAAPRACAPAPQPAPQPPPPTTITCPPYCEAVADLVEGHRIRVTCEC